MHFFDRMAEIDRSVAHVLEEQHKQMQRRLNAQRKVAKRYQIGDLVWVLRPRSSPQTTKLDSWWEGPANVVSRTGQSSYSVQLSPMLVVEVHDSHLKPH